MTDLVKRSNKCCFENLEQEKFFKELARYIKARTNDTRLITVEFFRL